MADQTIKIKVKARTEEQVEKKQGALCMISGRPGRGQPKLSVAQLEERTRIKNEAKQAAIDKLGNKKSKEYWRLRKMQIAQSVRLQARKIEMGRDTAINMMDSVIQTLLAVTRAQLSQKERQAMTLDMNIELLKVNAVFEKLACKK